jgi:DNA uptake protein ComE-like DNA-binding protein
MKPTSKLLPFLLAAVLAACGGQGQDPAPEASGNLADSALDATADAAPDAAATETMHARLNLNTATRDQFLTIPDVGDRMVHEFEEYRPYVSIQQFRREIGKYVSAEQVAAYEQYVYVPVNPNESDAETLQQLPGVEAADAAELIAGRPYASKEAFLEKLAAYVSAEERAAADAYVEMP